MHTENLQKDSKNIVRMMVRMVKCGDCTEIGWDKDHGGRWYCRYYNHFEGQFLEITNPEKEIACEHYEEAKKNNKKKE